MIICFSFYYWLQLFVNVNTTFLPDKPDSVELVVNTTENKDCSDLYVNFTCVASVAIPSVYNFLLYEKDGDISQSKSGIWIKKMTKEFHFVHPVEKDS